MHSIPPFLLFVFSAVVVFGAAKTSGNYIVTAVLDEYYPTQNLGTGRVELYEYKDDGTPVRTIALDRKCKKITK